MSLLAPLWLAGLAALLLPVALHLLSRGRARRVRIGSVQLLAEAAARQPRRIALQRPLLLLVRCLLLAAVALALAGPRRERAPAAAATAQAWLLVEPGLTGPPPAEATRPGADGEEPEARWLAPGLPLVQGGAAALGSAGARPDEAGLPDLAAVPGGLWSLLREAAAAAPTGAELRVVTGGRLATLAGERPALPQAVRWLAVPDARPNRWLERVSTVAGDSSTEAGLAAVVGRSAADGTSFAAVPLQAPRATGAGAAGGAAGGSPVLAGDLVNLPGTDAVPGDDALPLPPPARPVAVALIAGPGREADARFLAAAARAAAAESGVRLELVTTARAAQAPAAPALAFWLGDAPPPAALLAAAEAGGTLVLDAGRPEERCGGSVQPIAAGPAVPLRRCAAIALPARSTAAPGAPALAAWTSDQGRPLLLVEPAGRGRILRFAGRFHPAWSDLVLSPAFPAWLATLLRPEAAAAPSAALPASDRRGDGGQGAPARGVGSGQRRPRPEPSRAPELALWAALPLLLLAERWLAGRRR